MFEYCEDLGVLIYVDDSKSIAFYDVNGRVELAMKIPT